MIFKELPNNPNMVNALGVYHPYRSGTNPNFDDYSRNILNLKNGYQIGLDYFYALLDKELGEGFAIAAVPSHNPESATNGIKKLAQMLCRGHNRIDAISCLVRHTLTTKSATTNVRNIHKHLVSIRVDSKHLIVGKDVLLLDDVTTSHSSLLACQQLLIQAGAKLVIPFALAQTA